ncbi:MAG: serine/threonine-protein kinase [Planctomycetota bacterium]
MPDELSTLLAPVPLPPDGRFEQYKIDKLLGQGGMGVVASAFDPKLRRHVAIKIMKPELAQSDASRAMFLAEARAIAALNHENVVSVYEVGQAMGLPFFAMELLQGTSLAEMLAAKHRFTDVQTLKLALQLCDGLGAAHDRGIVHRDIKPANVFLEMPRGRVKLLDFGLARSAFESDVLSVLAGTPGYMSPEQARDEPTDRRSDVYSLGALLYRLLAGRLPLEDETVSGVLAQLLTRRAPPLADARPDLPVELCDVVDRCLSPEREQRPGSVAEIRGQLASVVGALGTSTPVAGVSAAQRTVEHAEGGRELRVSRPTVAWSPSEWSVSRCCHRRPWLLVDWSRACGGFTG